LPEQTSSWAVSPDGALVAIGLTDAIRVIDAESLGSVANLRRGAAADLLSWLPDGSLVAVTQGSALVWDPGFARGRAFDLPGGTVAWNAAADRLLLLAAPEPPGAGSVHLVEIGTSGVRAIELEGLPPAFDPDRGEIGVHLTPGLAYDPVGRRAFVLPPEGAFAEVDLDRGSVSYERPSASLMRSVIAALVPSASAKLGQWERVHAVWLGDGLVAVSGVTGGTMEPDAAAAGVSIVDTRDWSVCMLDAGPTNVAVSGGVLLAWGGAGSGEFGGTGLVGYDLASGERWHRFGRQYLELQVHGGYAYAINSWYGWRVRTVDLETGEVLARQRGRPPTVLPAGMSTQGW
jgi:hypothetical protein